MRNPLRSETDAFRFVLVALAYFVLIAIGSLIGVWVGLGVFIFLSLGAVWYLLAAHRGRTRPVRLAPAPSPPGQHRVLVVANETLERPELVSELVRHAAGRKLCVLVVAPALITPLAQLTSDDADARAAAQARLDQSVASFRAFGLEVSGEVGDADPVQAVEDALRTFRPDELVVATHPAGHSPWLERGVVEQMRERFALPLTHVVVDLDPDAR